ncbi:MAG: TetR/AcrR family transcriptional regulator [Acidiferrobacteraceae bacterium]
MPAHKSDEDTVVSRAVDLFRQRGYHRTTMAEVGAASGLLKGSLYHYFPGKEQLAMRAIETVHDYFKVHIFPIARHDAVPPAQRLKNLSDAIHRYFSGREGGCLIGNLALETSDSVAQFRPAIYTFFSEWITIYSLVYRSAGLTDKVARVKAREAVALIQGALMMNRVFRSDEPLRDVLERLSELPAIPG